MKEVLNDEVSFLKQKIHLRQKKTKKTSFACPNDDLYINIKKGKKNLCYSAQ